MCTGGFFSNQTEEEEIQESADSIYWYENKTGREYMPVIEAMYIIALKQIPMELLDKFIDDSAKKKLEISAKRKFVSLKTAEEEILFYAGLLLEVLEKPIPTQTREKVMAVLMILNMELKFLQKKTERLAKVREYIEKNKMR